MVISMVDHAFGAKKNKHIWVKCPKDGKKYTIPVVYTRAPLIRCPLCRQLIITGWGRIPTGGCGC